MNAHGCVEITCKNCGRCIDKAFPEPDSDKAEDYCLYCSQCGKERTIRFTPIKGRYGGLEWSTKDVTKEVVVPTETMTVGELRKRLDGWDDSWEIQFSGGLDFYRLKKRGDKLVVMEFGQVAYKDSSGAWHIQPGLRDY